MHVEESVLRSLSMVFFRAPCTVMRLRLRDRIAAESDRDPVGIVISRVESVVREREIRVNCATRHDTNCPNFSVAFLLLSQLSMSSARVFNETQKYPVNRFILNNTIKMFLYLGSSISQSSLMMDCDLIRSSVLMLNLSDVYLALLQILSDSSFDIIHIVIIYL